MPAGTLYHGVPLASDETLGPLLESIIVVRCTYFKSAHHEEREIKLERAGVYNLLYRFVRKLRNKGIEIPCPIGNTIKFKVA